MSVHMNSSNICHISQHCSSGVLFLVPPPARLEKGVPWKSSTAGNESSRMWPAGVSVLPDAISVCVHTHTHYRCS